MLDRFISAVIELLLAIPPVRFVMGLVDSRWRPLWATLWIAVILYVLSRTMNQLALRRARLRILNESTEGRSLEAREGAAMDAADTPAETSRLLRRRPIAPPEPVATAGDRPERQSRTPAQVAATQLRAVPVSVLAGAFVVAAFVVAGVAMMTRPTPNDSVDTASAVAPAADTAIRPDAPIDIRYRSGRMEGDHCIGTFEVTRGRGERARLVAFVMDTSGAIIGRDSAQVASAVAGIFVDFRFRYVDCDEIDNWQMQATTTPRAR